MSHRSILPPSLGRRIFRGLIFLLGLALGIALFGPPAPPRSPADKTLDLFYPTRVGAKWVYRKEHGTEEIYAITHSVERDGCFTLAIGRVERNGSVIPSERIRVSEKGIDRLP